MKHYSIVEIEAEMTRLGYQLPYFHLVGIRSKASVPDKFDDDIYIIKNHNVLNTPYACTTNPGDYWLKNLLNPKGAALLKAGQYLDSWEIRKHQGKYEALCQCKPVTVFRDADKDEFAEETGVMETGMFGINIHRANESVTSLFVGRFSAGCIVLANPQSFNQLMISCKLTAQKYFSLTILKEW